jgi:MoaA/NifB/PqqE/SkfB family radical SAM enzyme
VFSSSFPPGAGETYRSLRDLEQLKGRCRRCEFRPVCGGSRSHAFGVTGDLLEEEPWCTYQPGSFPYPREVAELIGGSG